MKNISVNDALENLSKSKFRSRFHLREKEKQYVYEKGFDVIKSHTDDFINQRLSSSVIPNDGKQTPMKGHPTFIAQHATACCCRGCLFKWYGIEQNKELNDKEKEFISSVIMAWIKNEMIK